MTTAPRLRDPFLRVPQTVHATSRGIVDLPILYEDASNVVALFEADRDAARDLLRGTGLVPAVEVGGKAIVALSFYDYRRTSVGAYGEVGTALFAAPEGTRPSITALVELWRPPAARRTGAWVVDLPVTAELANAAGREIWGYPKFVTGIEFELRARAFRCAVADPAGGGPICELAGTMGHGVPVPAVSLVTFSLLDGVLVRTHVDVRAPTTARGPGDLALRVGASDHRMAANLRALGLDGARPKAVLVTERLRSILHAGTRARGAS